MVGRLRIPQRVMQITSQVLGRRNPREVALNRVAGQLVDTGRDAINRRQNDWNVAQCGIFLSNRKDSVSSPPGELRFEEQKLRQPSQKSDAVQSPGSH